MRRRAALLAVVLALAGCDGGLHAAVAGHHGPRTDLHCLYSVPAGSTPPPPIMRGGRYVCGSVSAQPPPARPSTAPPTVTLPPEPPAPPVPAAAKAFSWADAYTHDAQDGDQAFSEAACFTVVRGVTPVQALHILMPHAKVMSRVAAEARAKPGNGQLVEAGSRDGWTFVLEDNNFLATVPDKLERLSRRGRAAVLYFNIELDTDYLWAVDGRIVRSFEAFGGADRSGRPLPQERGLPFTTDTGEYWFLALSMALTSRLTGLTIRRADVEAPRYSVAVVTTL